MEQTWQKVYQAYQEACDGAGLVDFAELPPRALTNCGLTSRISTHYRERFTNILVVNPRIPTSVRVDSACWRATSASDDCR
ncbi:hypothetical protein ACLK1S_23705 [Escherichia coli]